MAFNSLNSLLIQVGKAVKREIFLILKNNQDDIQGRLTNVESGQKRVVVWDELVLNATSALSLTAIDEWRVPQNFRLTDAKVGIFEKGVLTGLLEMDIQKSSNRDFSTSSSVFTTKPSIDFDDVGTNDFDESSNTVFDAGVQDLVEGEFLRLDISALPAGGTIGAFAIYLIGEAS